LNLASVTLIKKTLLFLWLVSLANLAFASTPQELLTGYEAKSSKASSSRGEQFFNAKHGKEWSCATCHETPPNHDTKHIVTGKVIKALSPLSNPARFNDLAKVEKWFKRNCNDVLARECSAQEKADVLSWLITIK
jgi:uncharacterized membrane protein